MSIDINNNDEVNAFYESLEIANEQQCESLGIETDMLDEEITQLLKDTCKPGEDIIASLTPLKAHLWHMQTGISGESGELTDTLKRIIIYNKAPTPEMLENIVEELADLKYYIEGIMQSLNITEDQVKMYLLQKLRKRYGKKYSDDAAINRADKTQDKS